MPFRRAHRGLVGCPTPTERRRLGPPGPDARLARPCGGMVARGLASLRQRPLRRAICDGRPNHRLRQADAHEHDIRRLPLRDLPTSGEPVVQPPCRARPAAPSGAGTLASARGGGALVGAGAAQRDPSARSLWPAFTAPASVPTGGGAAERRQRWACTSGARDSGRLPRVWAPLPRAAWSGVRRSRAGAHAYLDGLLDRSLFGPPARAAKAKLQ